MLLHDQILAEKIALLSIFRKIKTDCYSKDEPDIKVSPPFFNHAFLAKFDHPIVKFKEPYFTDIFKVFDKFVSDFCEGDKIIISRANYDDFLTEALQTYFMTGHNISFEFDLNFVISLVFSLFENNILYFYQKLFISPAKPFYETKTDNNLTDEKTEKQYSLFEKMKFNKLSLNVTKHLQLRKKITTNEPNNKGVEILKEKEDFLIDDLFNSMRKNKLNNKTEKEPSIIPIMPQEPVFLAANPCDFMNFYPPNHHFTYSYQNAHYSEEETLYSNEINKQRKTQKNSKNGRNSRTNQHLSRNSYDKRKKFEICFVPKQIPNSVDMQASG